MSLLKKELKEKYLYLIFKIVKAVCRGHPSFNGKTVLKSFNLLLTRQPVGLKIPTSKFVTVLIACSNL